MLTAAALLASDDASLVSSILVALVVSAAAAPIPSERTVDDQGITLCVEVTDKDLSSLRARLISQPVINGSN